DTEAPSEMNTWIPSMKALWMAENVTHGLHNIYTLRGTPVRDALNWSKYIAEALYRFGGEAEVMLAAHHWPRWGNDRIREVLRAQRDIYANMHNQVLHHANNGVTINQIQNFYTVPKALQAHWHVRGYHGSPEHNARGVIQRYLGYWDCNPATLVPPSPEESAPVYLRMMGGARAIVDEAAKLYEAGDYRMAVEILNKLALAEPGNQEGRDLMADALEQLGYQQENPGLRNSFLAGALELRSGIPSGVIPKTSSPDVMRAMSTELFLNFLGIRLDSAKAEGHRFTINLRTPDTGEDFIVELENATLTNIKGYQAENADLTLTIDRAALDETLMGAKSLEAHLADGTATVEGDPSILRTLAVMLVDFVPNFEVFPGTRQEEPASPKHDAFDTEEMKQVVPE
ncbi:MAG: alkyl sulfatase dimerization domain-containing protein, partial [Paracoccaceae bacterium]|nr:alkyl sulfatase dimerization domain-containing protein [Paracoccaceae bacterium]